MKKMKEYTISILFLSGLLLLGVLIGLAETNGNILAYLLTLCMGLLFIIKFREIGSFFTKWGYVTILLPIFKKHEKNVKLSVLMYGILLVSIALAKLGDIFGVQTSNNLLDWALALCGIYLILTLKQNTKYLQAKMFLSKIEAQRWTLFIGTALFLMGVARVFKFI